MKKLKLTLHELEAPEFLTRTQLKQILGGDGSGSDTLPNCQSRGQACYLYVNCCSGLYCINRGCEGY